MYESPIEERFAHALDPYLGPGLGTEVNAVPQAQIGRYRVDFLLTDLTPKGFADFPCDVIVRLVVECDGHDFHDRTKEQAARDRDRDSYLLTQGFPVVRFTGSQIHRDADACAVRALDALGALARTQAWGVAA